MQHRIQVTRKFSFDAAHYIPEHPGKCAQLHGHRWTAEITFQSFVTQEGHYGLDFGEVKDQVNLVIRELDHQDLNSILQYPSAEAIAMWLWEEIDSLNLAELKRIRIYETPDCYVTYEGGIL